MGKVDFSYLRHNPDAVVETVRRGYRVTDENLLETIRRCQLPLSPRDNEALKLELDPAVERRGRPRTGNVSKAALAARLGRLRGRRYPEAFLAIVIDRLTVGSRYTEADSDRDYARRWRTHDRDRIICGLYDDIYELLEGEPKVVAHEILGEVEVPFDTSLSRHEKALLMTHTLLRERTILSPPAPSTMLKIISVAPARKRRPRS